MKKLKKLLFMLIVCAMAVPVMDAAKRPHEGGNDDDGEPTAKRAKKDDSTMCTIWQGNDGRSFRSSSSFFHHYLAKKR